MKTIPLGLGSTSLELEDYASEVLDDIVPDAVVRKFRTDDGFVLATLWRGTVHEVTYQTPFRFFWSRLKRNRELFKFYGDGQAWVEGSFIDFGRAHRRADGEVRALYSKIMDFLTFTTTEFDDHSNKLRWEGIRD